MCVCGGGGGVGGVGGGGGGEEFENILCACHLALSCVFLIHFSERKLNADERHWQ